MAAKIKVIELAKELGVTSKDLMLAAEGMGHKGVRVMTPLDTTLANALRTKLGKGRDLPEMPKPKRAAKPKAAVAGDGTEAAKKPASRSRKKGADVEAEPVEIKPAATIVKPKPAEVVPEPPAPVVPEPDIVPEVKPAAAPLEGAGTRAPATPAPAPPAPPVPPTVRKPEPKIVPFRPI
ncbi:MAG: translation initiation factor IF-2 N-terminal domain-containing protein, partial [Candidatus Rokubacteria bacterium]|nr:translation initiation factor IF-2 N-terminal domain-containing protein [Candidatus Rokubacteria bacterium]